MIATPVLEGGTVAQCRTGMVTVASTWGALCVLRLLDEMTWLDDCC